jgi:D,D-heptose 1,7-bisphosphate phosphatase
MIGTYPTGLQQRGYVDGLSNRAAFVDRDGILNELMYFPEQGIVDSPFSPKQMRLVPFAIDAVNRFHKLGYLVIVISNQPGLAKGRFDEATFDSISRRMRELLAEENAHLDAEYYCFHHPNGVRKQFSLICDCRKPKPGLLIRAAKERDILLADSFFLGDGTVDVKAGNDAGCKTILVASANSLLLKKLDELGAKPDYLVRSLEEGVRVVEEETEKRKHS